MKKGATLEKRFEAWIEAWKKMGYLAIRLETKFNQAAQKYTKKQYCDYVIDTGSNILYLDSKECSSAKFYPKQQAEHQVEAMRKAQGFGRIAGFVVWFKNDDPAMVNLRFIANLDDPSTIQSGQRFSWDNLDRLFWFRNG